MASAIAGCASGLQMPDVTSQSSNAIERNVLAQVEWLPVTSHSHITHSLTVKCKISKMITRSSLDSLVHYSSQLGLQKFQGTNRMIKECVFNFSDLYHRNAPQVPRASLTVYIANYF